MDDAFIATQIALLVDKTLVLTETNGAISSGIFATLVIEHGLVRIWVRQKHLWFAEGQCWVPDEDRQACILAAVPVDRFEFRTTTPDGTPYLTIPYIGTIKAYTPQSQ